MMRSGRSEIEREAAGWLERMSQPVQDSTVTAEFDRWIADDPRHVECYARLSALWQADGLDEALRLSAARQPVARNDNGETGDDACRVSDNRLVSLLSRLRNPRRVLAGAAAAMLIAAMALPVMQGFFSPELSYSAPRGQDRTVKLADGSILRLNGGTRLAVKITPWSRSVRMDRGEAFFDVAHERFRPFSVDTGSTGIEVLGTAFDVDLLESGTREVRVYRGLVSVSAGHGEWRVPAGAGLAVSGNRVSSLDDVSGDEPGWINGWFDAQDTELGGLIERVNRMVDRPVVLADPSLAELRITGRFRIDEPAELLDTLAVIHGLHWREEHARYVLSREPR